jgi:hypothetical protein
MRKKLIENKKEISKTLLDSRKWNTKQEQIKTLQTQIYFYTYIVQGNYWPIVWNQIARAKRELSILESN